MLNTKKVITVNLLEILADKRVVLNGQYSRWDNVGTGAAQGSIFGPLTFLIYVNMLSDSLSSNLKLFADDISHFLVVKSHTQSGIDLNSDLRKISKWTF